MDSASSISIETMAIRTGFQVLILASTVCGPSDFTFALVLRLISTTELDLPEYDSYEALRERLYTAMTAGSEYFGFA